MICTAEFTVLAMALAGWEAYSAWMLARQVQEFGCTIPEHDCELRWNLNDGRLWIVIAASRPCPRGPRRGRTPARSGPYIWWRVTRRGSSAAPTWPCLGGGPHLSPRQPPVHVCRALAARGRRTGRHGFDGEREANAGAGSAEAGAGAPEPGARAHLCGAMVCRFQASGRHTRSMSVSLSPWGIICMTAALIGSILT